MKQLNLFENKAPKSFDPLTESREKLLKANPYLGPKSPRMGYKKYIASKEWKQKKRYAIQLADYKCEECQEKGYLEVHHANYDCLYHERFDDVWVLCKECHEFADEHRVFWDSYRTYMRKKYGRSWESYDNPSTRKEFSNWLEYKENYGDGWPPEDNYYEDDYC